MRSSAVAKHPFMRLLFDMRRRDVNSYCNRALQQILLGQKTLNASALPSFH